MSTKNNAEMPAFPTHPMCLQAPGLTKLEYFAGLAMQGILANAYGGLPVNPMARLTAAQTAEDAVHSARALLAELEKQP